MQCADQLSFFFWSSPVLVVRFAGKLYPREAWADLKFLSMDREQLALGMLRHTKSAIHNSLTQIDEEDKVTQSLAKAMFKNILGSAHKRFAHALARAVELLHFGRHTDGSFVCLLHLLVVQLHGRQEVRPAADACR